MTKLLITLPAFLVLLGCEQRAAQFAKQADALLIEYQKRIDNQIASSTAYYQRAAALSAAEAARVGIEVLQAERNERATRLEADYRENRRPVSLYRDDLRAYAELDFSHLKAWLSADVDASAPYLQQLVALESDKATIDAFDKILKNLAQPRSIGAEIKDIQQFVADSKTDFDKRVCTGISDQLNASPPPDKVTTLKALQKTQNCTSK
ncbi:MAG: hypothetical protein M3Y27_06160 [Acidobacteriota bacterium]|nr:hypothetical protein [Acidobacteriota bacterium]